MSDAFHDAFRKEGGAWLHHISGLTTVPNIPIPTVKPAKKSGLCNTCVKEDVCCYKKDTNNAIGNIYIVEERTDIFIETEIRCKKWAGKPSDIAIRQAK